MTLLDWGPSVPESVLGQVRDTSKDSVITSFIGFLIALRDFNGMS